MSRRRAAPGRAPAFVVAGAVALALAILPGAPDAAATQPDAADRPAVGAGALSVRITSLEPAVPDPGDTLTVRGTITNTSTEPVRDVSALLRVSTTALPSRGEIPEILSGAGERTGFQVPGARDPVADTLAPGQTEGFLLEADVNSLGLGEAGVYMTGAEAVGSTGSGVVRQDLDRTFLPWWPPDTSATPLSVTTLWPITSRPMTDATGTLLTEQPAVAMSPEGRLSTLVTAAAQSPEAVSLVLDPATVLSADAMSDGYEVRTEDGVVAGTRRAEVGRWLDALRSVVADPDADASAMLYAMPDLVAARRAKLVGTLLRQRDEVDAATALVLGEELRSDVALLPDGASDERTLSRLARGDVAAAVLSDDWAPPTDPDFFTPSGNAVLATEDGEIAVLVADSGLSETLAMPMSDEAGRTAARQRLLAETLVTVTELPQAPRLVVAVADFAWSPPLQAAEMVTEVLSGTEWIQPTSLTEALAREPSDVGRELADYGDDQQARELSAQHVGQVRDQFRAVTEYSAVLTDPDDLPEAASTAPSRGMSSWFRDDPVAGALLADTVTTQLNKALLSVRVVSSGSISVSGPSGTIPVTVENGGPEQVTVGLTMTSDPPHLFSADPVDAFPVDPGQRRSLEVPAQVAAAGPMEVTVHLTTADGTPFGRTGVLTVQSSAYANAARILVRAALIALALAVIVHGVRRARRMRRANRTVNQPDA